MRAMANTAMPVPINFVFINTSPIDLPYAFASLSVFLCVPSVVP
jgi:hypothetical protein